MAPSRYSGRRSWAKQVLAVGNDDVDDDDDYDAAEDDDEDDGDDASIGIYHSQSFS